MTFKFEKKVRRYSKIVLSQTYSWFKGNTQMADAYSEENCETRLKALVSLNSPLCIFVQ